MYTCTCTCAYAYCALSSHSLRMRSKQDHVCELQRTVIIYAYHILCAGWQYMYMCTCMHTTYCALVGMSSHSCHCYDIMRNECELMPTSSQYVVCIHMHMYMYMYMVPLTMSTLDVQCVHTHSTSVFELSLPHFFFSAYLQSGN